MNILELRKKNVKIMNDNEIKRNSKFQIEEIFQLLSEIIFNY